MPFSSFIGQACAEENSVRWLVTGKGKGAFLLNLKTKDFFEVPLGFDVHGFMRDPANPHRVWALEKWGTHAAEIDIPGKQALSEMQSPENAYFQGHGVFSQNGDRMFFTYRNLETGLGHLTGYDSQKRAPLFDTPFDASGVHDVHLFDKNTLVIAYSGLKAGPGVLPEKGVRVGSSALLYFDIEKEQVTHKNPIEDDKRHIGHLALTSTGAAIALTSLQNNDPAVRGRIYLSSSPTAPLERIDWPQEVDDMMKLGLLSVDVDEKQNLAAITNLGAGTVALVDISTKKFLKAFDDCHALGVSFDSYTGKFIVSGSGIFTIDSVTKKKSGFFDKTELDEKSAPPSQGAYAGLDRESAMQFGSHSCIVQIPA